MTVRLLHVHAGNVFGGVETILLTIARHAQAAPDVEHRFALCFEGRLAAGLREAGAQVDLIGAARVSRPWTVWRARRRLARLLAQDDARAVLCHSAWSLALFGPVARAASVPLVLWLHSAIRGPNWLERWARRSRPDLCICVSRHVADAHSDLDAGVPREVLHPPVAPTPADPGGARRPAARRSLGVAEGQVVILQASRLERWKGHAVLFEALAALREDPSWVCLVAGGPQPAERSYEQTLRRLVARLGIAERVRFLGERTDMPDLLAAADLFCQPSTRPEGFGMGAVEALYSGVPLIATDLGGTPEIADPSCAVLVPPGEAAPLAAALRLLIQHPEVRARLAAAGPARARALCDPDAQVQRLGTALRGLATGGRPR